VNAQVARQSPSKSDDLVKTAEVDEPLFYGRSHAALGERQREYAERHLRGMSDDMVGKTGSGLGKPSLALKGPTCHSGISGEEPSYNDEKGGKLAGWRMGL
jgi:hypothetical protein